VAGGTQTLPRAVGVGRALDTLMTNRWLEADEALSIGLVNQVVQKGDLLIAAEVMARKIARLDKLAARFAKKAVVEGMNLPLADGLDLEKRLATGLAAGRREKTVRT
jgi:enoyl-CoA hydratase/carnithine racemase